MNDAIEPFVDRRNEAVLRSPQWRIAGILGRLLIYRHPQSVTYKMQHYGKQHINERTRTPHSPCLTT